MLYLEYLFRPDSRGTLIFYTILTLAVFAMGCLSQRILPDGRLEFRRKWFFGAFFVLWIFSFFGNIGADYANYTDIYANNTIALVINDTERKIEPAFRLLCYLMRYLIPNSDVGLGLIKTAVLAIGFYAIYRMREEIHVGTALGAYTVILYFTTFNLLRFCLTSAMILLAWVYVLQGEDRKGIFWMILATLMHKTMLLCLAVYLLFAAARKVESKKWIIALVTITVIGVLCCKPVLQMLVKLQVFQKYKNYVKTGSAFGIVQFIYYVPVVGMLLFGRSKKDSLTRNWLPTQAVLGFAMAMMGYIVGMLCRYQMCFGMLFIVWLPMFIHQVRIKQSSQDTDGKYMTVSPDYPLSYRMTMIAVFAYFGLRFMLDVGDLMAEAGINPYSMWLF